MVLAVGGLFAGCSNAEVPEGASAVTPPKISPDQIAESRRQLEQSLMDESPLGRPNLAGALAPLSALSLMPEWGLPETAADSLARIGPAAVPALLTAMENRDPAVRARAAQAFARMGPEASAAVPALTRALQDRDPDVRKSAARALGQIGPAAESAIPALAVAMSQADDKQKTGLPTVVVPTPNAPGPSPSDGR
ncbi:MAG: HEAT repeat domain-containing protein [Planctomycetaceae bacterium]|nr:HEAT repeat domain-containing protein [Planctomycetaceae bacterium]